MRYDNWDVILFPRDSLVPIQEFRTACFVSQDEHGCQLPTLTCYVTSLPASTPFRISIHSWATPEKPSVLIESRQKASQKVVYSAQVIVDGARVFHGLYETNSKWPQEIVNEKRSATDPSVSTSQRGPFLEFPPFHQRLLMQTSWDARETSGRIKVLLSEQLIRKTSTQRALDFGPSNDIVCFAFQHGPRDILEQAGISWPIRNPLYLPATVGSRIPSASQMSVPHSKYRDLSTDAQSHGAPTFTRPRNPEPLPRPRTDPPIPLSSFPKSSGPKGLRPGIWDPSTVDSFGDAFEDMSMDSWATRRLTSKCATDISMPDMNDPDMISYRESDQQPKQKNSRQVVVTLSDDQLGQFIEAISPPNRAQSLEFFNQQSGTGLSQGSQTSYQQPPPKLAPMSVRPSASALARRASYHDLGSRPDSIYIHKPSPNKESRPPSQQESRLPTPYPHANRVPTPHPFVPHAPGRWDSDVSMRDHSSVFSSLSRQPVGLTGEKSSPVHGPSTGGNVRSRKARPAKEHDRGFNDATVDTKLQNAFDPGHKSGMSSIDSTGRLERTLFSALGEELNSFAEGMDATTHTDAMSAVLPGLEDLDTPLAKRKRQGTFGAERGPSPVPKMIREEKSKAEA